MALDERDFFNNRNETRTDTLTCPRCKRANQYQMRWVVRTRKDRIPPGADERDREGDHERIAKRIELHRQNKKNHDDRQSQRGKKLAAFRAKLPRFAGVIECI